MAAPVLYVVSAEVRPEADGRWRAWMADEHMADVCREPGFLGATLRRDVLNPETPDGWVRWEVHYEVATRADLDAYLSGEAVRRLRAEGLRLFAQDVRLTRRVLLAEATVRA